MLPLSPRGLAGVLVGVAVAGSLTGALWVSMRSGGGEATPQTPLVPVSVSPSAGAQLTEPASAPQQGVGTGDGTMPGSPGSASPSAATPAPTKSAPRATRGPAKPTGQPSPTAEPTPPPTEEPSLPPSGTPQSPVATTAPAAGPPGPRS